MITQTLNVRGNKDKIKNIIGEQPGCGIGYIAEQAGLSYMATRQHVFDLVINGEIKIEKNNGRIHLYPVGAA